MTQASTIAILALSILPTASYTIMEYEDYPAHVREMNTEELLELAIDRDNRNAHYAIGVLSRHGKPVTARIKTMWTDSSREQRRELVRLLGYAMQYDPEAVQALVQILVASDDRMRMGVFEAFVGAPETSAEPLTELLRKGDAPATIYAAQALVQMKPSKDALPLLRDAMYSEDLQLVGSAAQALAKAEAEAVPFLIEVLDSGDEEARRYAIIALWRIAKAATGAVPALGKIEASETGHLRALANIALDAIQPGRGAHIDRMIKALSSNDVEERRTAIEAIYFLGEDGFSALPAVVNAIDDDDERVSSWAIRILSDSQTAPAGSLDTVLRYMQRETGGDYHSTSRILNEIGPTALPHVLGLLREGGAETRLAAATALQHGLAKHDSEASGKAIAEALLHCDGWECTALLRSLPQLDSAGAPAIPIIWGRFLGWEHQAGEALAGVGAVSIESAIQHLTDSRPEARWLACYIFANVESFSVDVSEELFHILEQDSGEIAWHAIRALTRHDMDAEKAVPAMIRVLQSEYGEDEIQIYYKALQILEELGAEASEAAPLLRELAQSSDRGLERMSKEALAAITGDTVSGATDKMNDEIARLKSLPPGEAVPQVLAKLRLNKDHFKTKQYHDILREMGEAGIAPLIIAMNEGHPDDRVRAGGKLIELGYDKHEVCKSLSPLLRHDEGKVREWTLGTLSRGEALDVSALPHLIHLIENRKGRERSWAISTLEQIRADQDQVLPVLMGIVEEGRYSGDRSAAISALGAMGADATPAVPGLVALLANKTLGAAAAGALAAIGPAAFDAVRPLANSSDPVERKNALQVLSQEPNLGQEIFEDALNDPSEDVAKLAAHRIQEAQLQSDALVETVLDWVNSGSGSGNAKLRVASSNAEQLLPDLIARYESDDPGTRARALEAMTAIGPRARTALPIILLRYRDAGQETREAIVTAMDRISTEITDWDHQAEMMQLMLGY